MASAVGQKQMTTSFTVTDRFSHDVWKCSASFPPQYETEPERRFPVVYLMGETDTASVMDNVLQQQPAAGPFILVGIEGKDWNTPFSPWPALKLGKHLGPFAGGGDTFLALLATEIKPYTDRTFRTLPDPAHTALAGYSLAGLLTLYAFCSGNTAFSRFACMSGSLWYPGWTEFLRTHLPPAAPRIYLSLGNREKESRSPVMSQVENCTHATVQLLQQYGVFFEWNDGGHFNGITERIAKGIAFLFPS